MSKEKFVNLSEFLQKIEVFPSQRFLLGQLTFRKNGNGAEESTEKEAGLVNRIKRKYINLMNTDKEINNSANITVKM
jgi:hypothetical protein